MKVCTTSCALALIFAAGSIASCCGTNKKELSKQLKSSLDKKQLKIYDLISKNRGNIYKRGLFAGMIVAMTIIVINLLLDNNTDRLLTLNTLCLVIATVLIVSYLFYMISPKGVYMVSFLKTKKQRDNWVEIYRVMQHNYHLALALAVISVLFASKIIC
jgi:hypothetical protein